MSKPLASKFAALKVGSVLQTLDGAYRLRGTITTAGLETRYQLAPLGGKSAITVTASQLADKVVLSPRMQRVAARLLHIVAYNKDNDLYVKEAIRAKGLPVDESMNWGRWFQNNIEKKLMVQQSLNDEDLADEAVQHIIVQELFQPKKDGLTALDKYDPSKVPDSVPVFDPVKGKVEKNPDGTEKMKTLTPAEKVTHYLTRVFKWRYEDAYNFTNKQYGYKKDRETGEVTQQSMQLYQDKDGGDGEYNILDQKPSEDKGFSNLEEDNEIAGIRDAFEEFLSKRQREGTVENLLRIFDYIVESESGKKVEFLDQFKSETGKSEGLLKALYAKFGQEFQEFEQVHGDYFENTDLIKMFRSVLQKKTTPKAPAAPAAPAAPRAVKQFELSNPDRFKDVEKSNYDPKGEEGSTFVRRDLDSEIDRNKQKAESVRSKGVDRDLEDEEEKKTKKKSLVSFLNVAAAEKTSFSGLNLAGKEAADRLPPPVAPPAGAVAPSQAQQQQQQVQPVQPDPNPAAAQQPVAPQQQSVNGVPLPQQQPPKRTIVPEIPGVNHNASEEVMPINASQKKSLRDKIAQRMEARKSATSKTARAKFAKLRRFATDEPAEVQSAITELADTLAELHEGLLALNENLDLVDVDKAENPEGHIAAKNRYARRFRQLAAENPEQLEDALNEIYHSIDNVQFGTENLADALGVELSESEAEAASTEEGGEEEAEKNENPFEDNEPAEDAPVEEEVKEASGSDWFVTDSDKDKEAAVNKILASLKHLTASELAAL